MRVGYCGQKKWRRRNEFRLPPRHETKDYFGGLSPVFFVSCVEVSVLVPPGVEVVVFFSVFALSLQPTKPIESTLSTRNEPRKRFIFHSSSEGLKGPIQHRYRLADCQSVTPVVSDSL